MKIWGVLNFLFCSGMVIQLSFQEEGLTMFSNVLWAILSAEILIVAYFILGLYTLSSASESDLLDDGELGKSSTIGLPLTFNVFSTLLSCLLVFTGILMLANRELMHNQHWPLMSVISLNLALYNIRISFSRIKVEEKTDLTNE